MMLIIKQTKYVDYSAPVVEYFTFNADDDFEEHKIQNELITVGIHSITYDEVSVSTLRFLSMDDFKSTSLEQFIKIQKVLTDMMVKTKEL